MYSTVKMRHAVVSSMKSHIRGKRNFNGKAVENVPPSILAIIKINASRKYSRLRIRSPSATEIILPLFRYLCFLHER